MKAKRSGKRSAKATSAASTGKTANARRAKSGNGRSRASTRSKGRLSGRDPTSQLYRAIIRYVESRKGSIIVIGGVQIEQWPGDGEFKYVVGVRCMGRKPMPPTTVKAPHG